MKISEATKRRVAKRRVARLYTDTNTARPGEFIFAVWQAATTVIEIPILLAAEFIRLTKRGSPWECVLAEAIKAYAKSNPEAFPHEVRYVHVIGTTLYIVTGFQDRYGHHPAMRYSHNFTKMLRKFDEFDRKKFKAAFEGKTVVAKLGPPRINTPGVSGRVDYRERHDVQPKPRLSHGALRRAIDAHLVPPQ